MLIAIAILVGILTVCVIAGMILGARKRPVPVDPAPRGPGDSQGEQLSKHPR